MVSTVEKVFKALADPTRRRLLDELFETDGQTLSALEATAAGMSRFGVMKHLAVLEDATMGTDHTVSWQNGTAPIASGTAVFEIFIKTTPQRLWEAITDPEQRAKYSFGVAVHSEWTPGSDYRASAAGGFEISSGRNIEVDPPWRLVQTFQALWSDEVKALGSTRVTWEIEPIGSSCRLTVVHDQLPPDANPELYGGWPMILSGLKTLLETGELLDTPGSLRYSSIPPAETGGA